jgi:hypothetical protein
MQSPPPAVDQPSYPEGFSAKRTGLAVAAALVSVNIWTGAPLLALWIGSRLGGAPGELSMTAVAAVIGVLAVEVLALAFLLTYLNVVYDEVSGRPQEARRTSPWLRSLRGEREQVRRRKVYTNPIERIVIITVVVAILTFEVWLFFFAHYHYQGY